MSLAPAPQRPVEETPRLVVPPGSRARLDEAVRLAGVAALWLSLLLVTYWWVAGGGVSDLAEPTQALVSLGRETGLVASVLLLAQVVLMARVPWLEHAYGQDRLARIHRVVGFTSFTLMLAHVVLITWGYALGDLLATPLMLWDLTVDYPGILLADAGTLALVMVVVTSMRFARRRLRYESWHLLHLYAYLGAGLALPHQLWTGQELLASTGRQVFFWGWWIAGAAAVLVWRLGLPAYRTLRHRLVVTSVVREPAGAGEWLVSLYLTGRRMDRLPVEAGQFLSLRLLTGRGWSRTHPYSLSAAPDGRSLRFTVKVEGDGGRAIASARPGTRVMVEGPYGRLTARPRTRRKVLLMGAGVGITPLRALAEGLSYAPGEAMLVQRCTQAPLFAAELDVLSRERGLQVLTLAGRRRDDDSWLPVGVGAVDDVTALLSWVPDLLERDLYLCGPDAWVGRVREVAEQAGLPASQIHLETFRW
ncbi:ferredoxin reductase family protein [Nocardioides bruguierae]|uniref:Ferredoxin reductase family protein n=1 Tax=Nocardioides bruguierae TaxID=2945102 RepID=A0A9X2IF88_9ACTN|nr:ferredoxin reductase family protein [Nocardioides bruguierae]MCM0619465.1 ferredoxin reductase family protein [Nocardioides bruguierae]